MTPAVYVSLALALIAAASLGYTIYEKRRSQSKRLSWSVIADATPVPGAGFRGRLDDLSIHYQNRVLRQPRLFSIVIVNAGRVELKRDDINLLPKIEITDATIVSARVSLRPAGASRAEALVPNRQTDTLIEAPAVVLNPQDSLIFTLLVDGGTEEPEPAMQAAGFTFTRTPGVVDTRALIS